MKIRLPTKLLKTSSIYFIANIFNSVVPFILIPFLTEHLSTKDYAFIALISLTINFIAPFVGLSVHGALLRRYYNDLEYNFKSYLSNCLYILLISSLIFGIFLYFFGDWICDLFLIPDKALKYIIIISSTSFVHQLLLTTWRANNKPAKYAIFQISLSLINLIFTIVLISRFDLKWEGRIYSWAYSNVIFASFCIIYLYYNKFLFKPFEKNYVKDALKFSIPLIPHSIGAMIFGVSSRLIVGKVLDVNEVGIFSVAFQFGSVLSVVFTAFNTAFVPWLFEKLKKEDVDKKYLVVTSYKLMGLMIGITTITYITLYFMFPYIVNIKFEEAQKYLLILCISFMFSGLYYIVTNYIFYMEKTRYLAYSTGIIGAIHIPLCYILTQNFGLYGTSTANLISYILLFALTWYISNSVFPLPWKKTISNFAK